MVKSSSGIKLFLALVMMMANVVKMAPTYSPHTEIRNVRSTYLERITGHAKIVRIYINNHYLQIFEDGTVNGTTDESSDYIILQTTAVTSGHVRIEGLATCSFLCMDSCGLLYSTSEFRDECVFNETFQSNYNSYSSVKYSNENSTLYLALTEKGKSRKAMRKNSHKMGKLAKLTNSLPFDVTQERVKQLEGRKQELYSDHKRHSKICPPPYHKQIVESSKCKKRKVKQNTDSGERSEESGGAGSSPSYHDQHSGKRRTANEKECRPGKTCKKGKNKGKKPQASSSLASREMVSKPKESMEEAEDKEATTIEDIA